MKRLSYPPLRSKLTLRILELESNKILKSWFVCWLLTQMDEYLIHLVIFSLPNLTAHQTTNHNLMRFAPAFSAL